MQIELQRQHQAAVRLQLLCRSMRAVAFQLCHQRPARHFGVAFLVTVLAVAAGRHDRDEASALVLFRDRFAEPVPQRFGRGVQAAVMSHFVEIDVLQQRRPSRAAPAPSSPTARRRERAASCRRLRTAGSRWCCSARRPCSAPDRAAAARGWHAGAGRTSGPRSASAAGFGTTARSGTGPARHRTRLPRPPAWPRTERSASTPSCSPDSD